MHCHLRAQCDIGSCFKLATVCKVHCHDWLTAQLSGKNERIQKGEHVAVLETHFSIKHTVNYRLLHIST